MIADTKVLFNQKVTQGKGNIVSDMGGEKVMLSINNGKYYNLGEIGGEIWDLIQDPINVKKLVTELMTCYEVEQLECEEQVISFLTALSNEGLIEVIN
jgi:hypothetical protein